MSATKGMNSLEILAELLQDARQARVAIERTTEHMEPAIQTVQEREALARARWQARETQYALALREAQAGRSGPVATWRFRDE